MLYYNNVSGNPFVQSLLKEIATHLNEAHVVRASEVKDREHYLIIKDSTTKRKVWIIFMGKDVEIKIFSRVPNIPENIRTDYRIVLTLNTNRSANIEEIGRIIGMELGKNSEYIADMVNGKPFRITYMEDQEKLNESNVFSSRITSISFDACNHANFALANGSTVRINCEELGKIRVSDSNYVGKWYVRNSKGLENIFPAAKFDAMFCRSNDKYFRS